MMPKGTTIKLCNIWKNPSPFSSKSATVRVRAQRSTILVDHCYSCQRGLRSSFAISGKIPRHSGSKSGDRQGEGTTLNNISQIYDRPKGTTIKLCNIWKNPWPFSSKSGTVRVRAQRSTILVKSTAHAKRGLRSSFAISGKIPGHSAANRATGQGEGTTLNNISQIYDAKGDYDQALQYLEKSLAIRQQIGDRKGEGTTLNNISQIYDAKRGLRSSFAISGKIPRHSAANRGPEG